MKNRTFTLRISFLNTALFAATLAALSGCGADKTAVTKVAAKVNGAEISVDQLNGVLVTVPGITPATADQARREVLDKLIEQQLAIEQTREKKLDKSPEVLRAIDAASREILARAYRDQVVAALPKASAQDARTYYAAHPQLFAQRRVYNLQEIIMPAQGVPVDKLRDVANEKSIDDIANWLKQQNIRFSGSASTRTAEQLPLNMLPKLHELKDGQSAIFTSAQTVSLVRIAASQSAPIDEATALPQILKFLDNQSATTAMTASMKQLREKAKIDIVAAPAATPEALPTAPAATLAKPAEKVSQR